MSRKCKWMTEKGQCGQNAMMDSEFCESHAVKSDQIDLGAYAINKILFGDAPERHAKASELKSLRTEIALLKTFCEKRINLMESDADFISSMGPVKDAFMAIEKLVVSCHNMEVKIGELLSKQSLMSLAQKIVHVISTNLEGVENKDIILEKVGKEIVDLIAQQEN